LDKIEAGFAADDDKMGVLKTICAVDWIGVILTINGMIRNKVETVGVKKGCMLAALFT
jgi:hypothetical protein